MASAEEIRMPAGKSAALEQLAALHARRLTGDEPADEEWHLARDRLSEEGRTVSAMERLEERFRCAEELLRAPDRGDACQWAEEDDGASAVCEREDEPCWEHRVRDAVSGLSPRRTS